MYAMPSSSSNNVIGHSYYNRLTLLNSSLRFLNFILSDVKIFSIREALLFNEQLPQINLVLLG